jgi:mannose-6-phosphate isomerase-like protein (cupin superfamily)
MRLFTLGIDAEGRSCVNDERDIEPTEAIPGVNVANLFSTIECPPPAPPPGQGAFDDMGMTPGTVTWMLVDVAPFSEENRSIQATELHYNNTIELFCVLEGSVNTILGNGSLHLRPGDCVAMPGVDHATRAGSDGARILSISIALGPPN